MASTILDELLDWAVDGGVAEIAPARGILDAELEAGQSTILVAGLMVFSDHALLGLGLMLSAGEVPRIAIHPGGDQPFRGGELGDDVLPQRPDVPQPGDAGGEGGLQRHGL